MIAVSNLRQPFLHAVQAGKVHEISALSFGYIFVGQYVFIFQDARVTKRPN